jgi:hypothetical protein
MPLAHLGFNAGDARLSNDEQSLPYVESEVTGAVWSQTVCVSNAPASGTTTTTTLATNVLSLAQVVTDAAGNAMVVWGQATVSGQSTGIYAARYDNASAAWSGPERISGGGYYPRVAIDGLNDVTVAWLRL